jgi:hypothetical protein
MNTIDYKERVKRLRKAVSAVLNVECSQSQAYELMAKEDNYPNWDAMSGSINKKDINDLIPKVASSLKWSNVSGVSKIESYNITIKTSTGADWSPVNNVDRHQISKLNVKEQITQLFFVYEGLRNGLPLYNLIAFLKEQNNPIIKKGWSNVTMESNPNNLADVFVQTNFFNDDVITMLKLSCLTQDLASGVHSAIQYLKTL